MYLNEMQVTAVESGRMKSVLEIKLKHGGNKVRASRKTFSLNRDFSKCVFRLKVQLCVEPDSFAAQSTRRL